MQHFTAKDFRTWAGTVLACAKLKDFEPFATAGEAKKNVVDAIKQVAERLGNTPSVCRKCYVHPAVLEGYLQGEMERVKARVKQGAYAFAAGGGGSVRVAAREGKGMTIKEFRASVAGDGPGGGCGGSAGCVVVGCEGGLGAGVHGLVDDLETGDGMAVHAYLHRKEGDVGNAEYWYRRAGIAAKRGALEEEWVGLVERLLN